MPWARSLVLGVLLVLVSPASAPAGGLSHAEWLAYVGRYIAPEGRVVDTYNEGVSHSEGQGYGMLLAVAFDDRTLFEELWRWTRTTLQVRDDRLFAWRFEPADGGAVTDTNNATDGDILIAWALLRAHERWRRPAYARAADAILADVRAKLIAETAFGPVLLPAAEGFARADSVVVNLSYWVFPALERFAETAEDELWDEVIASGHELLREARFGDWGLPPDWLEVGDELALPADFAPVFGYNAVRVPLYLAWSAHPDAEELLEPFRTFWAGFDGRAPPPDTVDLENGTTGEYPLSKGGRAIAALARFGATRPISARAMMPPLNPSDDYYASTLLLLSKVALEERSDP